MPVSFVGLLREFKLTGVVERDPPIPEHGQGVRLRRKIIKPFKYLIKMCQTYHPKFLLVFVVPVMIVGFAFDSVVGAVMIVIVEMEVVAVGLLNGVLIPYYCKYSNICVRGSPMCR